MMVAIDTNLLARLLLNDDAAQHQRVKALFKTRQNFTAPVTVMLELVWVLESYDCTVEKISTGLTALLDLPNFKPERADALRQALLAYAQGMGFADALHLALCSGQQKFITFDKAFAKRALKMGLLPEVTLA
jgi:predicted nucleic-acid-binding protein